MSALCLEKNGVEIRKGLLSKAEIEAVKADIDLESRRLREYGVRNLEKKFGSIAKLVANDSVMSVASEFLNGPVRLVRALFFDKTPRKNWSVSWHQNKTVTLNERVEIQGWTAWTIKDGVHHAQAPLAVLNRMITFRLHIDAAAEDNGCLRVIPGTHRHGILTDSEIRRIVNDAAAIPCVVGAGDAVVMRPHVLHSSRKADRPGHRRVVHIEYSDYELPDGAHWA